MTSPQEQWTKTIKHTPLSSCSSTATRPPPERPHLLILTPSGHTPSGVVRVGLRHQGRRLRGSLIVPVHGSGGGEAAAAAARIISSISFKERENSMSAQPAEELGSEGKWFGEDYGRNGLFGNAATRFDEPRTGEDKEEDDLPQQFNPFQGDDGKRPAVAMETASTGKLSIFLTDVTFGWHSRGFITNTHTLIGLKCKHRPERTAWSIYYTDGT